MSAQPPEPDDPIGIRYPNTARIWNYQLGGREPDGDAGAAWHYCGVGLKDQP